MLGLRLRSVKHKLLLMVLVANLFTLAAAGGALLYHDLMENRAETAARLAALAAILSQGSAAALEFDDAKVANENLAQLRANPNIVEGAIYSAKGALFARYARDAGQSQKLPVAPETEGLRFSGSELVVFQKITAEHGVLGSIYLKERYELSTWLRDYLAILGVVLLASLALGLFISSQLQRWISGPIQAVSDVARQVMAQRDFHLRAPKSTEDEVGQLADAFNGMLQTLEHEIAERSSAEQSVRRLNAELEARVVERTAELQVSNQALVTRTDEAEAANRAKADFLANMSHEIRTPMNGILGLAYLLDQRQLEADAAEMVKKIRNAGRSLQSIINDILDFSKIEAGRLEIEHAPFRIADVFDNLAGIMAANAGGKNIELVIATPPDIGCQLLGDALRLEQILINLTGNAIKFTDKGDVSVGISLLAKDAHNATFRFSVKDSGIGIPPDKQAHIFAAFSQADISTTRRYGGTGLGLSICRHLVTMMGGEIGVISGVGQGSEFWFTIPFAWTTTERTASAPEMTALDILIADDSEIALENLSLTARSMGWSATKAESGAEAVQKVRAKLDAKQNFDVLLIDWKMPGMDGLAAAASIRSVCEPGASPVVLMVTAFSRDDLLKQANMDQVDGVLTKPVTGSALYNIVAEVLRRRGHGSFKGRAPIVRRQGNQVVGVRVLVVDDSEINREVAQRILEGEGASVQLAIDGQAAIDWLRDHLQEVDIVLMDVQMPIMDGYEATRQLRALPHGSNLPVVALTAGAFKAQQDAAREAGMTAFVSKPFNVEELIATIQHWTHCPVEPAQENTTAAEPSNLEPPPVADFPGIAVAQGVALWGDVAVYQQYLRKFASVYSDCAARLSTACDAKDFETISALLHKIKGTAGNLALLDIARCAADAESIELTNLSKDALAPLVSALETAFASIALFAAE